MPGSPSRVTAVSPDRAAESSCWIAASSIGRPTTDPVTRRNCTASEHCGWMTECSAVGAPTVAEEGSSPVSIDVIRK